MINFEIFCPECGAILIVTSHPDTVICEPCPACKSHIWDAYDLMMAEAMPARPFRGEHAHISARTN